MTPIVQIGKKLATQGLHFAEQTGSGAVILAWSFLLDLGSAGTVFKTKEMIWCKQSNGDRVQRMCVNDC